MKKRLRLVGVFLAVAGLCFGVAAAVAYAKVQDGYDSLQAISEQQNVTLNYNEDGQLVDRGETEEAEAIMSLLKDDWQYPVVNGDLDPSDPLVNTATRVHVPDGDGVVPRAARHADRRARRGRHD